MKSTHEVGLRELRENIGDYVERARDGDEILITDRGQPVARIVGLGEGLERLIAEGVARPPRAGAKPSRSYASVRATGSVSELIERR
ncbi:MAG: type II toxin-antitoxin system prevent-host-death family antitoxin [Actinomycetota bacterium]